ncbi:hypothetical protein JYU34_017351 [Plutella xylostella]|uniref:Uncharacterized protein n=1 Tax=Plutella xylostella TaxID=51655 RepID=A0ABQ7Q2C9_PLUXY|nr:hypothetical protein JYU34_017351 [Plutella xylostella]
MGLLSCQFASRLSYSEARMYAVKRFPWRGAKPSMFATARMTRRQRFLEYSSDRQLIAGAWGELVTPAAVTATLQRMNHFFLQ